jgi:hypothetical protein
LVNFAAYQSWMNEGFHMISLWHGGCGNIIPKMAKDGKGICLQWGLIWINDD